MAPPSIAQYRATTHGFKQFTSSITDRKRDLQGPKNLSRQYAAFVTTTLRASTAYLRRDVNQPRKFVSELRRITKHTSLDGKNRPHHQHRSVNNLGRRQQEPLAASPTGAEKAVKDKLGFLEMDWKEQDEKHERPCYWSLLQKLNRELQFSGEWRF